MTNISSPQVSARLGESHGYRFDGDFVHLNADIYFADADLYSGDTWSLQLWASENGFSGNGLAGVKVAELAIAPLAGGMTAAACCNAMPPAGAGDQVLALALVSCAADGRSRVHDLAVYAGCENFFQPRLLGNVSCTLADGMATLLIDAIVNPRAADNLSGTLALEVWALDAPYAGGNWAGSPVASVIVGILAGGYEWRDCQYSIPAAMPADGAALTVMLREWSSAGYVTRDYRNLDVRQAPLAPAVVAEIPPLAQAKPAAKSKVVKTAAKVDKAPLGKTVAVNTASEAEMLAVKGLSASVARAIIAGRPYQSVDELCRAKGMGPKLLAKLRDQFVL